MNEPQDFRENVVQAVRESLPEFAKRNGIELDERTLDNLSQWVAGVVPPWLYRRQCWATYNGGCACTGYCQKWLVLEDIPDGLPAPVAPPQPEAPQVGGVWHGPPEDHTT